ncbi:hypothetical protein FD744_06300 [Pantoea sp. Taur]|nr:hypothetical protein [Pantoea sp. Taur]
MNIDLARHVFPDVAIMHRGDVFARSENGVNTFGLTFALTSESGQFPDSAQAILPAFSLNSDSIVSKPSA